MKPYVLQRWCATGAFLGCWAADSEAALQALIYDWMQRMQARGYDVAPFPGGVVACRPLADGKLEPVRMIIVEPQTCALEAAPLPAWITEATAIDRPSGGQA